MARTAGKKTDGNKLLCSFAPVVGKQPRVLILGSMPSERSLQQQQYYAHPQNRFWNIIETLLQIPRSLPYEQRLQQLADQGYALWDVLNYCERPGSLDSDIKKDSMVPNDIPGLLQRHPSIQQIFFNGRKAQQVFDRHILPNLLPQQLPVQMQWLPSTSPANASISKQEKLKQWEAILL
ncbi:MAG: DNA-deoxyinosine glycosylase [Chromatiales bacterium]|jgi:hypoxanthine-DNA glycosylase